LESALVVSSPELPLCILALDVVAAEFSNSWDEFCTVAPGALHWYDVRPTHFAELATRLREAQQHAQPAS